MVMTSSFGWGQNADLQYMLDKSFCNFLDHFHKETSIIKNFSEFRVVDSYIPYGLEMVSNNLHDARVVTVHAGKIHNLIKTRKKYKYSYAQLGSIYMTGADTISFQIGFWKYIEPIVRASYLGSNFYTMFGINDRGEAEEAHLTQKEIAKRIERSRVWDIVPDSSYDGGRNCSVDLPSKQKTRLYLRKKRKTSVDLLSRQTHTLYGFGVLQGIGKMLGVARGQGRSAK